MVLLWGYVVPRYAWALSPGKKVLLSLDNRYDFSIVIVCRTMLLRCAATPVVLRSVIDVKSEQSSKH